MWNWVLAALLDYDPLATKENISSPLFTYCCRLKALLNFLMGCGRSPFVVTRSVGEQTHETEVARLMICTRLR